MDVKSFFDADTGTLSHILIDTETSSCAIIDPVLDFDLISGQYHTTQADKIIDFIQSQKLTTQYLLETHIHADHLTASYYLKQKLGGEIGISSNIIKVLDYWVPYFNNQLDTPSNGEQFDLLFEDNARFNVGNLSVKVWHTPGHTPACVSYLTQQAIFVGDSIMPSNIGSARCDFFGGCPKQLFNSIQRFYSLPDNTRIYYCHDYPEANQAVTISQTIAQAKQENNHIQPATPLENFVELRQKRDATLAVPKLLYPAVQTNLRAGKFGTAATNGKQYIKIPVGNN